MTGAQSLQIGLPLLQKYYKKNKNATLPYHPALTMTGKDKERFPAFRPFSIKRPDAASALSDESLEDSGFYCVIDTKGLSRIEELSLCCAVKTGERLTAFEFASS